MSWDQWFSTYGLQYLWDSTSPFTKGQIIRYSEYQIFMLWSITTTKLQLWHSNKSSFSVRITPLWGTVLKRHGIWKVRTTTLDQAIVLEVVMVRKKTQNSPPYTRKKARYTLLMSQPQREWDWDELQLTAAAGVGGGTGYVQRGPGRWGPGWLQDLGRHEER